MDERYDPKRIEPKWQAEWERSDLYRTREDRGRPKFYLLEMFPYPSGNGLSVGHLHNYVPCDVIGRYKRMTGHNVLHAMGWDAFGLPAENEALIKGKHPKETVPLYAANFKRQLNLSGCAYDWSREINSAAPEYYRWTQWFFLLLYKRGLAYRAMGSQWWCEQCRTILANEQVVNGCCWRHTDLPVSKKDLEQWYLRITAYADRLLEDLDLIDWPEPIKLMQRNWIGRSSGAESQLPGERPCGEAGPLLHHPPRHGLRRVVHGARAGASAGRGNYQRGAAPGGRRIRVAGPAPYRNRADVDGQREDRCLHRRLRAQPLYRPGHPDLDRRLRLDGLRHRRNHGRAREDQRDFEFASKYGLEIPRVTAPLDGATPPPDRAFTEHGITINSGFVTGMPTGQAIAAVAKYAQEHAIGQPTITYRMRDWLISRQRYWGAPIPIVYCRRECGIVPVPDDQLPVMLPDMKDYQPSGTGRSPLANVPEFVKTTCPRCGGPAERETDTLDGFACSSWYYLRFASPHYDAAPFDWQAVDYWLPVDLYVGGAEHAVMHLLYARMWTKVMYDAEMVKFKEPFQVLRNQGVIWASDGRRMSKSKGNVVTPDAMIDKYGADALRLWELYMGPYDEDTTWNEDGVAGTLKYLRRVWSAVHAYVEGGGPDGTPDAHTLRDVHKTIQIVTGHLERLRFNTALAAMMSQLNLIARLKPQALSRFAIESYVLMLAPMAPHFAEELWRALGHQGSIHLESWPKYDPELAKDEMVTVVVQVNGKVRERLQVGAGTAEEEVCELALKSEAVVRHLAGKPPKKVIYVPDKLVSIVA